MLNCIALHFSLTISFIVFQKSHLSWNGGASRKFNVSFNPAKFAPPSKVHAGHHRPGYICPKSNCRIGSSSLRGRSSNLIDSGKDLFRNGLSTSPNFIFWKSLGVIQQLRGQNFAIFWPLHLVHVVIEWPLIRYVFQLCQLHRVFECLQKFSSSPVYIQTSVKFFWISNGN